MHVLLHRGEVVSHLRHLRAPHLCALAQTLLDERILLAGKFIVFFCLEIILAGVELLLLQLSLMLIGTVLGFDIHRILCCLVAVVELVLLQRQLGVAKHILLLSKLALGIEDLQVEVGVAQPHDDVALMDVCAFIYHFLQHDTTLFGRDLHNLDRHHIAIHGDVIIKLSVSDITNTQASRVDFQ